MSNQQEINKVKQKHFKVGLNNSRNKYETTKKIKKKLKKNIKNKKNKIEK